MLKYLTLACVLATPLHAQTDPWDITSRLLNLHDDLATCHDITSRDVATDYMNDLILDVTDVSGVFNILAATGDVTAHDIKLARTLAPAANMCLEYFNTLPEGAQHDASN